MAARPSLPELAGTLPDAEVAALADASIAQVLAYRRAHRIPPFVRSPPGRGTAEAARTGSSVPLDPNEEDLPDEPEGEPGWEGDAELGPWETEAAPEATEPGAGEAPAVREQRRRGRLPVAEGRLAAYADQLGQISDGDIAERAGLSLGTVGAYRRKLGIPAYAGFLWQKGHEPVGGGRKKKTTPARGQRADIDRVAALVGTVPDRVVAEQAGVSRSAVTAWRREQGIAAANPHLRPPATTEQAAADTRAIVPVTEAAPANGAAPASNGAALAFTAVVRRVDSGEETSFVVLGADIAVAAMRARTALASRRDGPWRIEALSLLGEAIA